MSTIAVAAGSDLRYQGSVTFDTTVTDKLKGYEYPMIVVSAYQNDLLVYQELAHADATFVLGGGSSDWVGNGGGAAHCTAALYSYPGLHSGDIKLLAGPIEFDAAA